MPSLWLMRNADGETEDYALRDVTRSYRRYCIDARGELVPYEQVLANARFCVESQGVTATAATAMARALPADMPAWRGRH
jgi:hypothetical protein